MTQNRLSNDKDLFYPIGIIRKLFRYGQKNARLAGTPNDDYEWFKNWIKDYVGDIRVITKESILPLTQVQRLEIDPADYSVTAITNDVNGSRHTVLTEKGDKVDVTVPMQAQEIRGIHIDHSPTMATVLSATKGSLPAMNKLAELIWRICRQPSPTAAHSPSGAIVN